MGEVRDAAIEEPTDVVLRITSSALSGSDLHMYDGRTWAEPGLVLGHEPLGVVEAVGSAVELVKEGDRVVVPTHLSADSASTASAATPPPVFVFDQEALAQLTVEQVRELRRRHQVGRALPPGEELTASGCASDGRTTDATRLPSGTWSRRAEHVQGRS